MHSKAYREIQKVKIPRVEQSSFHDPEKCPDHWTNKLLFGHCWRHNADGSIKKLFVKN